MASIRVILAVCALVVLVVELYIVCASSGKDYDFQVIVQIGSKLRQANAGVRECGEFM
jgi:Na+/glutamate symporter